MNQLKQATGILGMMAGLAGIALQNRVIVWIAIGLLGLSVVFRLILSARSH